MNKRLPQIRAIITGATGFIGSHLVQQILANDGHVAVIVRESSPNLSRLPNHPNLHMIQCELENTAKWSKRLEDFEPQLFYHLAWKGVGNQDRNDFCQVENIQLSLATLRAAKDLGCIKWIGAGSQAEYGSLNCRISENEPTHPTTLYGAAKLATCMMSQILGKQLKIDAVWVRIFSTYGPGDNEGWLLPDVIKKLLNKEKPMLTPGEQLWDYLYVRDAAEAFLKLSITKQTTGIYNLGSGKSQSIRSIVELTRDLINPELELGFGEIDYRLDQVMHLEANIEKITQDTSWYPKTNLATGIENLIEYLRGSNCMGERQ